MQFIFRSSSKLTLVATFFLLLGFDSVFGIFNYFFSLSPKKINSSSDSELITPSSNIYQNTQQRLYSESTGEAFGEECDTNGKQCDENKFLDCIDGFCACRNPLSHAFDEELKKCVGLSGSRCGSTQMTECVKFSKCIFGVCQCLDGFVESPTRVCLKKLGTKCLPNECNGEKGLACIRGTCQCVDSTLVYDHFGNNGCVNPQVEFDKFARKVGRNLVQSVISRTVRDASSLVWLPIRLLVPVLG